MHATRTFHLLAGLLVLSACGDDGDASPRAAGGGCGADADCQLGLICEFQLCHTPCTSDATCPGAARCVRGLVTDDAGTTRRICQLEETTACTRAIECLGKQVCADTECRDVCTGASDCASDQVCATNDRCYSANPSKDPVVDSGL